MLSSTQLKVIGKLKDKEQKKLWPKNFKPKRTPHKKATTIRG